MQLFEVVYRVICGVHDDSNMICKWLKDEAHLVAIMAQSLVVG
jgi:hypothetical protein